MALWARSLGGERARVAQAAIGSRGANCSTTSSTAASPQQYAPPIGTITLQPPQPAIAQPQNGLPKIVIPNFASAPSCGPGSANPKTLTAIAAKLHYVLSNDEKKVLQAKIDALAKMSCADDRLAAFFLNLLARGEFAIERPKP